MKNHYLKICITVICLSLIVFLYFFTNGFGINAKYPYGNTIEEALNYYYKKGTSETGCKQTLGICDIPGNKKLVFFITTQNTLSSGILKKKWNGKWEAMRYSGVIPFDFKKTAEWTNNKTIPALTWAWSNMEDFGLTYGIVFDDNVKSITVGNSNGSIIRGNSGKTIWYRIDNLNVPKAEIKPNMDIKAYDKDRNMVYSYYPLNIDEVISDYIVSYNKTRYLESDKAFEAHKLLGTEEKNGLVNAYIYSLYEGYSFIDGKFKEVSGGFLPALIVLKNGSSGYTAIQYKEPTDGSLFAPSIRKMFPAKYADQVLSGSVDASSELQEQINAKARKWLKAQGKSEELLIR